MNHCTIHPNNPKIFLESFLEGVGASIGESRKNSEKRSILHCPLLFELNPLSCQIWCCYIVLYSAIPGFELIYHGK